MAAKQKYSFILLSVYYNISEAITYTRDRWLLVRGKSLSSLAGAVRIITLLFAPGWKYIRNP